MWSSLPTDLLQAISTRLLSWADHVSFRSVCSYWRSALPRRPHLPLLFIRFVSSNLTSFSVCNFPNMEFYSLPKMPEWSSKEITKWTCGCSRGWLGFLDYKSNNYSLHNPFTGVHISLPDLDLCYKFVLSCDPAAEPNDCVVMVFYRSILKFCRLGDTTWTPIIYSDFPKGFFYEDITFYKGKFYMVSMNYGLFVCNLDSCDPSVTEISSEIAFSDCPTQQWHQPIQAELEEDDDDYGTEIYGYKFEFGGTMKHLVISTGDLLLVTITNNQTSRSTACTVYRIDMDGVQLKLFKLEDLGCRSIFLDSMSSLSLKINDTPPTWYKGNCIYYVGTEDRIVVFNLEDHSITYMTEYSSNQRQMHWFMEALS